MLVLKYASELPPAVEKELRGFAVTSTTWAATGHDDVGANLDGCPVGAVMDWAGVSTPDRWLRCNGGAYSRTTYRALFKAIGVTHGSGDGSTTFNVPTQAGVVGAYLIIYAGV